MVGVADCRVRFGPVTRTPAMQPGIFTRPMSLRSVIAWPPKLPTPAQQFTVELDRAHSSQHTLDGRLGAGEAAREPRLVADSCRLSARYSPLYAAPLRSRSPSDAALVGADTVGILRSSPF